MQRLKTVKGMVLVFVALFAVFALAACGDDDDSDDRGGGLSQLSAQSRDGSPAETLSSGGKPAADQPKGVSEQSSGDDGGSGGSFVSSTRKIIFTSNISLEANNVTG